MCASIHIPCACRHDLASTATRPSLPPERIARVWHSFDAGRTAHMHVAVGQRPEGGRRHARGRQGRETGGEAYIVPAHIWPGGSGEPWLTPWRRKKGRRPTAPALTFKWRRGRDSNPRTPEGVNGFRDRRIQPLCHPSVGYWLSKSGARRRHRTILAESLGFEPRIRFRRIHDFQSCSFGHSDNSPGTATASIS